MVTGHKLQHIFYEYIISHNFKVVISTNDFTELKSHTWRRNSRAIGVSLCACYNATSNDLGEYAPTPIQIENTARVMSILSAALDLPITDEYFMTHAEAADLDGYGPATTCERWDLSILQNGDEWMSGGNTLRGKANYYLNNGVDA